MRINCVLYKLFGILWKLRVKRKTFFIAILTVKLLFSFIVYIIYKAFFTCGFTQINEAVSLICNQYKEGKALGNMCHDLCVVRDLKPIRCQPRHLGKDVVFVAFWHGNKIMIKASKLKAEQYDPIYWTDDRGTLTYPDEQTFYDTVHASIKSNLNTSCYESQTKMLKKVWTVDITNISQLPTNFQHTAMNNIWTLVQQTEYLFSKCLEDKNILPKVVGSCGHMYAVEYIPPLQTFMYFLYPTWQEEFKKRAEWAKLLLKLVELLDVINLEAPALGKLHICDVKIDHFGFDGNQIRLLDADMLFFESVLSSNMKLINGCSSDKDCSFIDCESLCNLVTKQCSSLVKDNNLKCNQYKEGKALGNMCHDLCVVRDLKPIRCQPRHLGKDVVFVAFWHGNKIMIKASKLKAEQYDPIYWTDDRGTLTYPDEQTFYDTVHASIKSNLNTSCYESQTKMLKKVWTVDITNISQLPTNFQHTAMNNIWTLVQQTEYLFSKCLEDKNILPKVVGSCGHMYAVEYIPPLQTFMYFLYPTWQEEFKKRAEWAKLLLKLVELLDVINLEAPALGKLHICDVKIDHFGFDGNQIRLLDADMLFFESVLSSNMKLINGCSSDKDCSFIDCESLCNLVTKQCSSLVKDNNLKRICRNVFSGRIMQHFGLLSSPPVNIAKELQSVLMQCKDHSKNTTEQLLEILGRI